MVPKISSKRNKRDFNIVVKANATTIQNAPDRTLLLIESEGYPSYIYYRDRGHWLGIVNIKDFPHHVPKQILGLYTLLIGV
jgi:hypothetical protein